MSVRRPDGRTDLTAVLDVTDVAMSTSYGSGVLDPMTGQPGARLRSATVVGPDAASTDAYATALMACGLEGFAGWPSCVATRRTSSASTGTR